MFLRTRNFALLTYKIISKKMFARSHHVAVMGSASELGQTPSMMLRTEPSVSKLTVHDNLPQNKGVILDLSHIPSVSKLEGFTGAEHLTTSLKGASLILAVGGLADVPGITKDAMFHRNKDFIKQLSKEISKLRPMPFVGIATEPINSMVPMAAELISTSGNYDPRKLFGITGIDCLKAVAMYAAINGINPYDCYVPIVGGHSPRTMVPLLSQAQPVQIMNEREIHDFTEKLRNADGTVTNQKKGWGPSLSVACSVLQFTRGIINALDGRVTKLNVFVENNDYGTSFFQGLTYINGEGVMEMAKYKGLSDYECDLLEKSILFLRQDITDGQKILEIE